MFGEEDEEAKINFISLLNRYFRCCLVRLFAVLKYGHIVSCVLAQTVNSSQIYDIPILYTQILYIHPSSNATNILFFFLAVARKVRRHTEKGITKQMTLRQWHGYGYYRYMLTPTHTIKPKLCTCRRK